MSILAASVTACPDPSGTQVVLYGQKLFIFLSSGDDGHKTPREETRGRMEKSLSYSGISHFTSIPSTSTSFILRSFSVVGSLFYSTKPQLPYPLHTSQSPPWGDLGGQTYFSTRILPSTAMISSLFPISGFRSISLISVA